MTADSHCGQNASWHMCNGRYHCWPLFTGQPRGTRLVQSKYPQWEIIEEKLKAYSGKKLFLHWQAEVWEMSNIHLFGLRMRFILKCKSRLAKKKKCITLTSAMDVASLMWVGVLEKPGSKSNGMLYGIGKASE